MMKKLLILVIVVTFSLTSWGQVGIGTPSPNKSAQLEIVAKDKGILIPRVPLQSATDESTIVNGNVDGLMVYNTENNSGITPGFYYWYQDSWKRVTTNDDTVDLPDNIVIWDVDNNQFTYIDENGDTQVIKVPESITTLVAIGDGTYEYTSEDGTVTLIDVPTDVIQNFETIVNGGPVEIDGTSYPTIKEYIEYLVKENETITTLEDKGDGTYEYTSEDGTVTLIDVPADVISNFETIVNGGPVEIDGATYNTIKEYITHLVEENETITTLEDKGDGTYEYTSEDGTVTLIDVPADVVNNFEEIINSGPVEIDGATYNTIKEYITHLVEENETITILEDKGDGVYEYTSEDGTVTLIDVPTDVIQNFETIVNGGPVEIDGTSYTTIKEYIEYLVKENETVTTLEDKGDGTYEYTSEDGTVTLIDVPTDVIQNFETIVNGGPVEIDGTSYTTIKEYITHLVEENETITTLVNNNDGTYTYTSEDDTEVTFDVTQSGVGDPNTNGVTGKDGDVYIDESTGDVYTYANGTWNRVTGAIKTGEGDPNTNGTPGEEGDIYIDNSTGAVYIYNDQTGEWEISSDNLTVEDGVVTHTALDGTVVTFDVTQSGMGDPNTNSVTGKDGDVYIDESTGDVYTYANGTWNRVTGTIKTGEGDPNDNGTPGEEGDIYIDNSTGAVYIYNDQTGEWEISSDNLTVEDGVVSHTAIDGTVVTFDVTQTGVGDPTTNNIPGKEGDIYVDESTGDIYTYANGTWNKVDGGTTITKNTVNYNGDIIDGLPVVVYEGTTHINANTAETSGVDFAGALPAGANLEGVITITLYQNGSLITSSTTDVNITGEKVDFNIGIGNMYQVLPEGDYDVIIYATVNE